MIKVVMRFLGLVLFAATNLVVSNRGIAQVNCSLTEADAPAVRGIRLGMSTEQLLALFPASTKRREIKEALANAKTPEGEIVYFAFEPGDADKNLFDGVASILAGIAKGRVVEFSIQYLGPAWSGVDEWVGTLSQTLKLPGVASWQHGPNETPNKVLRCKGIEIEAAVQGSGGTIILRNVAYLDAAKDHMRTDEEKRKRDYKP